MKKQLLIILLAFTPFLLFSNQQPSNAELLAHLKQVKTELNEEIKNLNGLDKEFQKEFPNKEEYDYYIIMKNFWKECQSVLTMEAYKQIINKVADFNFTLIYEKTISLEEIEYMLSEENLLPTYSFVHTITFNQNPDKLQQKQKLQLQTLFKKHFKKYLLEIPSLKFFLLMPSRYPIYAIPFLLDQKALFPALLQKINTTIDELEQAQG